MPTFDSICKEYLISDSTNTMNIERILELSNIGEVDISEITVKELNVLFNHLYYESHIRGVLYSNYKKSVNDVLRYAEYKAYIKEAPQIPIKSILRPNHFNKPKEEALQEILLREGISPISTIIHLAWKCGLMRNELTFLEWKQIGVNYIELEDRIVPLPEDTFEYLHRLYKQNNLISKYVLVSTQNVAPMTVESVSLTARRALDSVGQKGVRLSDLRIDYIIQLLNTNDWEYVSFVAGVDLPSLEQHYLPYIEKDSLRNSRNLNINKDIRNALIQFITDEEYSNCGIAIRLVWETGIPATVLPSLTWNLVDFNHCEFNCDDRIIPISAGTMGLLKELKDKNGNEDNHIFLTESTKKPMDLPYLQRIVSRGLVRNGILGVSLSGLKNDYWENSYNEMNQCENTKRYISIENSMLRSITKKKTLEKLSDMLLSYLSKCHFADIKTIKQDLELSDEEADELLLKCRNEGKIEMIGRRYFLKGTVVPIEKQHEVILDYVKKNQPVTSNELTDLLGLVERRQIFSIIKPLLSSGALIRKSVNKYYFGSQHS